MLQLDHIIYGSLDLELGFEFVEALTGAKPVYGGIHPGQGTRNALMSLNNRQYLEIMSPDPQQSVVSPFFIDWMGHENPASTAPLGCSLKSFTIRTEQQDELRQLLDNFEIDDVQVQSGQGAMNAQLDTPQGEVEVF